MSEHKYEFGDWVEVFRNGQWVKARYIHYLMIEGILPNLVYIPDHDVSMWFDNRGIRPARPPYGIDRIKVYVYRHYRNSELTVCLSPADADPIWPHVATIQADIPLPTKPAVVDGKVEKGEGA